MTGKCVCGTVILIKDYQGNFSLPTSQYTNVRIVMRGDGEESRMKCPICKVCAKTINAETLYDFYKDTPAAAYYADLATKGITMLPVGIERV